MPTPLGQVNSGISVLTSDADASSFPTGTGNLNAEGEIGWNLTRKFFRTYDGARERAVTNIGFIPYAFPMGYAITTAHATAVNLAAVSGGNGGAIAIPIPVPSHMLLQSLTIRNTDTASARTAEFRLFEDRNDNSNTLDAVTGSDGTFSFTPSAASNRTANVSSPGLYLPPGLYWLVLRNTSSAQTFGLGSTASGAGPAGSIAQTKAIGALGTTLDFVAATWTKVTASYGVRLDGRVFGQTSAF